MQSVLTPNKNIHTRGFRVLTICVYEENLLFSLDARADLSLGDVSVLCI